MTLSTMEWIFGLASLLSLLFAIYTYFSQRSMIHGLIEKLRSARNGFEVVGLRAKRIVEISKQQEHDDTHKQEMMRQVAYSILDGINKDMNDIDEGRNWGQMTWRDIYAELSAKKSRDTSPHNE